MPDALEAALEELLDQPGDGTTARATAAQLAATVRVFVRFLQPWVLRPGCCEFCGEALGDTTFASRLGVSWSKGRTRLGGGPPQGGRNSSAAEGEFFIWMHTEPCYVRHREGISPDQRMLHIRQKGDK